MTDSSRQHDHESNGPDVESGRYTMAEAARVKGVSYHTVSRAVRSGKLPAQRLGRMALIDANDLRVWQPMRERAPRKYRREAEGSTSRRQRPAIAQSTDAERSSNRLTTAITTLHEGAANRTTDGFGDWLASLTASLLSLRQVMIWQLDDTSGRFVPFGSVGIDMSLIPLALPESASDMMRHLIERASVQRLDPMLLEQIGGTTWLSFTGSESVLAIPCRQGVRTLGLIVGVAVLGDDPLSDADAQFARQFGSQAAIAIEHVELRRSSHQTLVSSPALVDDLPLQVMAIDRFGQLVYVNHEVVQQWGEVVRDKYVGRHYAHFVGMFRRERLDGSVVRIEDHPFTRALRGEHVHDVPHLVPGFLGAPRIFSLSSRPLHDEHGVLSGAVLVSRDVTVELQAADGGVSSLELLSEARRKVDLLGALSTEIGRWEKGDEVFDIVATRVCDALRADSSVVLTPTSEHHMMVRSLHQLSSENLELGRVVHRLQVPGSILAMAQRELFFVTDDDAGPSGRVFLEECKARGAVIIPLLDGSEAMGVVNVMFADPAQLHMVDRDFARAIGRQCGHAVHLRSVVRELEASHQRLLTVLDQLPQAVVIVDAPDGNIVAVNREAGSLWGVNADWTGMRGHDIAMLDQEGRPIPGERRHPFMRPLHTRETEVSVPLMTQDASGAAVDVLVDVAPIIGAGGGLCGAVAVLQRREHFKPVDQAKDEFISVVAHELRNPLTSLRGNLQLLERRLERLENPAVERELERVESAIKQVDLVGELVSRMLDISRADLGKLTIDPAECDAVELANRAIREIEGQSEGRTITLDAPSSVPVIWDQLRIQQMLINLLTNAVRYAPEGDIEMVVGVDDHDRVAISVRDHGPGVPPRLRRRLFRLYYRFDDGEETKDGLAVQQRGLGIGLYISARLAKAHGGDLKVEDAEGGGARFVLTLPRRAEAEG